MDINEYDEFGRTPLMNAAIAGDIDEVRRLIELGADPDIVDENWGTSKAVNYAGRLANKSDVHRSIVDLLLSIGSSSTSEAGEACESQAAIDQGRDADTVGTAWPYETVRTVTGRHVTRLRSSIFYWGSVASLIGGLILLSREVPFAGFLVLTLSPCLLLYPSIRFLFGGKDSLAAAITTVVVEELVKHEIQEAAKKSSRRR